MSSNYPSTTLSLTPTWLTGRMWLSLFLLAIVLFVPDWAHAQAAGSGLLPSGEDLKIPGAKADSGPFENVVAIMRFVLALILLIILGFGLSDSMASIFGIVNDVRNGTVQWVPALKQIGLVLAAIGFAFLIFFLVDKYVIQYIAKLMTS